MGFDGLISFLIRNLPNDTFDEINLNCNQNKLVSKHVLVDISFILYNCYIELENDINLILKYIYALSCTDYNKVLSLIEKELKKDHWKDFNVPLDGDSQDEISDKFINFLVSNDNEIFFKILSKYTSNKLENIIENLFETEFITNIVLFFDSIPSYSKILEQRKRRIKNYLESQNRKEYYVKYFSELKNDNVIEDDIEYDYFSWLSKKFNCNKIIDSNSVFVKNLKDFIINSINIHKKINIKVDHEQFGEADYKIFKYISQNKLSGKITILSCDSDLVYQLMLQQHNYSCLNKDINLNLFKFYINSFDYCQYFGSKKILDYINNNYLEVNNIKENKKNNFILDFMFILNFFGNDFLPSSLEIGPEVSFNILIKTHYNAFINNNEGVIVSKDFKNTNHKINFNNLKLWLIELNKNSSFTKIILLRQYKVPYNITYILTERLNLNLTEIRDKILKPYLIYKGSTKDDLDDNDIRKILYNEFIKENKNVEIENPFLKNFGQHLNTHLTQLEELLEDYLDFLDLENYGLMNNSYNIEIGENMYQNLYNFISTESYLGNTIKNISFDFKIEEEDNNQVEEYLLMLHFIVKNFFNDMEFYKSTNLTRYSYDTTPSIENILKFLEETNIENLENNFNIIIDSNILDKEKYIDSILHHLIITPYLLDSNYIDLLDNKELLKKIISNFNEKLNSIWTTKEIDNFNKIDPKTLLKEWYEILYKINEINKLDYKNYPQIEI